MLQPKVLMISNYLSYPKHNKNVWHDLSERLSAVGWQVITTSSKENQLARLVDMLLTILLKRNQYSVAQIDVFSGQAFVFAELSMILLQWLRKPVVLTLHGGRLPEFALRNSNRIYKLFEKAQVIVTPSPFLQQSLSKFRTDIRLIENPVDLSLSVFRVREKVEPKLVWVRSFHKTYNPQLVPIVLFRLIDQFPEMVITMIGPDEGDGSKQRMLELAQELGIAEKIRIMGSVDHSAIPAYLNQNDIFINTSNYDTAPRSLIEAMANGLCIVTTNVGGIPWIVENNDSALLVEPDNPEEMTEAVRRILTGAELAKRLSTHARLRANHYDWDEILPRWMGLFKEVSAINV